MRTIAAVLTLTTVLLGCTSSNQTVDPPVRSDATAEGILEAWNHYRDVVVAGDLESQSAYWWVSDETDRQTVVDCGGPLSQGRIDEMTTLTLDVTRTWEFDDRTHPGVTSALIYRNLDLGVEDGGKRIYHDGTQWYFLGSPDWPVGEGHCL